MGLDLDNMEIKICNICGKVFTGDKYVCSHVTFDEFAPYVLEIDGNSLGRVLMGKDDKLLVERKPIKNKDNENSSTKRI